MKMLRRSTVYLSDDAAVQRRTQYARLKAACRTIVEDIVERVVDDVAAAQYHQSQELEADLAGAGLLGELPLSFGGKSRPAEVPMPRRRRQPKKKKKRATSDKGLASAVKDPREGEASLGCLTNDEDEADARIAAYAEDVYAEVSADTSHTGLECTCFWSGDNGWYPAVVKAHSIGADACTVCFGGSEIGVDVPIAWLRVKVERSLDICSGNGPQQEQEQEHHHELSSAVSETEIAEDQTSATALEGIPRLDEVAGACEQQADAGEAHMEAHSDPATQPNDASPDTLGAPKPKRRGPRVRANWSGPDARNPHPNVPDKYWAQRFRLFSLFDCGLQLDAESWFSATPEVIACHTAERCRCDVLLDPFCGIGGNVLQFAQTCHRVIAIDLDPNKIAMARHNAHLYGVLDRIEFVVGDAISVMASLRPGSVDVVYLSPPWGGPDYLDAPEFDLETMIQLNGGRVDGKALFTAARRLTPHVAYFLPRTTPPEALAALEIDASAFVEVEDHVLNDKLKTRIGYYGDLVQKTLF